MGENAVGIEKTAAPRSTVFMGQEEGSAVEMLKISHDGFYVRGVKIEQGEGEAQKVYDAFIAWMYSVKAF